MAIIYLYTGTDMSNPTVWSGSLTQLSPTQYTITGENNKQITFGNFSYYAFGPVDGTYIINFPGGYLAGEITRIDSYIFDGSNFILSSSFQGLSITVDAYNNLLNTVGVIGLYENLLAGSDTLNGSDFSGVLFGYASDDVMHGNGGADTLYGGEGSDAIYGEEGGDYLDGGSDVDTLVGGSGDDTYVVDNVADIITESVSEGFDVARSIVAYTLPVNVDVLELIGADDIDGTGNGLDNILYGNSGVNTLVGLAGADTLHGGSGGDGLYGGESDDYLDGDSDIDTLVGGGGDDIYILDNAADVIVELASEGLDVARSMVTYILPSNVDVLELIGDNDIDGIGNDLDNILSGNNGVNTLDGLSGADALYGFSGSDELYGGEGNDYLDGGAEVDTLVGGSGDDTYILDNAADAITEVVSGGWDIARSTVTYTLPVNVDALVLIGADSIDGMGNGLENILSGNNGANALNGSVGADIMAGGPGNDTYVVDNSGDHVMELGNSGIDHVQSNVTYDLMQAWHVENLTLIGGSAVNGSGNWLDNLILGNAEANHLDGNRGNDTLDGGGGNDSLAGGAGDDVLVYDATDGLVNGGAGIDVLRVDGSGVSLNLAGLSGTVIRDIEVIDLSGAGDNTLTLTLADVLAVSSTTELLRIDGDVGDVVNRGGGWSAGDDLLMGLNNYHTYTQGLATLLVDTDITSSV